MHQLFYSNLSAGTRIFGKYTILSTLHSSDSSAVYLCCIGAQTSTSKLLCLKVTHLEPDNQLAKQKIKEEYKVLEQIKHENIVAVHEHFEDASFFASAMDYVEGKTLRQIVIENGYSVSEGAINLIVKIARGLGKLHSLGLVHHDIKPENIIVTPDGSPKIIDFGLTAYERHPGADKPQSESAIPVCGTVDYISPELIKTGHCDSRADLYALGMLSYYLFSGELPYQSLSIEDTLYQKAKGLIRNPSYIYRHIPPELGLIVQRAIHGDPLLRYQTAECYITALQEFTRQRRKLEKSMANPAPKETESTRQRKVSDSNGGALGAIKRMLQRRKYRVLLSNERH